MARFRNSALIKYHSQFDEVRLAPGRKFALRKGKAYPTSYPSFPEKLLGSDLRLLRKSVNGLGPFKLSHR